MAELDVCLYESIEDLTSLEDEWSRVLAETPNASFFQTLAWLRVYWQHFGDLQLLRVLAVSQAGQLAGILPLTICWEKTRLGNVRVLGYPLDNWGTSYGPIGAQPAATLATALSWLQQQRRDWDVLELQWATADVTAATEFAFQQANLPASQSIHNELSWIELDAGWDAYWASRTGKLRNNVRRGEKRLASLGRLESIHLCPETENPRWDLYQQCERVAARSWQADVTTGNTLSDSQVRDFLRDAHAAAVEHRAASINLLMLNDDPIAFSYDYVFQNRVYGLRTGFDPAYATAGPGAVLMASSLQAACHRGDLEVDLGETPSAYKSKWRTKISHNLRFCHYPRLAWRAQALRWKRQLLSPRLLTLPR